jgi:hypothetical protein
MAENDNSWTNMKMVRREGIYAGFKGYGVLRSDYRHNVSLGFSILMPRDRINLPTRGFSVRIVVNSG